MDIDRLATTRHIEIALVALQAFQVLFLWIHDRVPLGHLNDVDAVRRADPTQLLVFVTFVQRAPFSIGLLFCLLDFGLPYRELEIFLLELGASFSFSLLARNASSSMERILHRPSVL